LTTSFGLATLLLAAPVILAGGNVSAQATPSTPAPIVAAPGTPQVGPRRPLEPAAAAARGSGLLVIPFLGLHSFQNASARREDAGLRVGVLLGGRINRAFSIGGEVALDVLNPNEIPAGDDVTALSFHVAFSPLVHVRSGATEFVVGPKLGLFAASEKETSGGFTTSSSIQGWLYGINMGIFGAISEKVSLGGLLSFDVENATEFCETQITQVETCSSNDLGGSAKVLGVTLALLF
jgi:hypothetical protein